MDKSKPVIAGGQGYWLNHIKAADESTCVMQKWADETRGVRRGRNIFRKGQDPGLAGDPKKLCLANWLARHESNLCSTDKPA